MDLASFAKSIAQFGLPLIGAALPIPGGMAIGTALASAIGAPTSKPEDILSTLTASADAVLKAKQFEAEHREHLMQMAYNYEMEQRKADSADLAAVNTTMQAEAAASASENWWQKGWRPANGYVLALASLIAVIFVCILFYQAMTLKDGPTIATVVAMIPQLAFAIASILAVPGAAVGITAWHRGRAQIAEIQAAVK